MIEWKRFPEEERPEHEEIVLVWVLDQVFTAMYHEKTDAFYSASFKGTQPTHWARINEPEDDNTDNGIKIKFTVG